MVAEREGFEIPVRHRAHGLRHRDGVATREAAEISYKPSSRWDQNSCAIDEAK